MDGRPLSIIEKVGGVWAGDDLELIFQQEVANLLQRGNPRHFPGAQPVSFAKQHIQELKTQDYFVCEKTDGIRYLMYLTSDNVPTDPSNPAAPTKRVPVVYLIDRKNKYYYVPNLRFPHQDNPHNNFHVDTILDGELVEDRYPDGSSTIKFLVFDLLVIDGKDLRERTLDKRLGYLKQFILHPYKNWLKEFPAERHKQAFILEDKKTEFSYSLATMFHEIIPQVKQLHGNDGLIFTCKGTKYESGTDPHILKWKPPEENTVDFLMHITWQHTSDGGLPGEEDIDYDEMPADIGLYIYHGRDMDYSRVGSLYLTLDEWEMLKAEDEPLQDAIVECFLEDTGAVNGHSSNGNQVNGHGDKRWRYHRRRDDKNEANHVSTFDSVKISIEDHITQQDLLDHADEIRTAWKARDAKRQSRA
ncbi:Dcp1p-Dcp2p decapping enzyme complex alpha subunit [Knufia fluminis]|uniref:mRNA guanylyltransferase n=1 Tax=Knufia fluminis TaxID=191047 RepID=A0AAN8I549_9EURO|nr:Dcp1p-Dcp2p decapping enzyme complex alpha subunit [Knufia fluminis]